MDTSYVGYSTMSDLDKKLYKYFGAYEEGEQDIKIIEPSITDVIKHFTKKFPIYTATFATSVDGGTGGEITFKDGFIPGVSTIYTTKYMHNRELMKQSGDTKKYIIGIAEAVFGYGFEQEN